jgi:hypothetical protein
MLLRIYLQTEGDAEGGVSRSEGGGGVIELEVDGHSVVVDVGRETVTSADAQVQKKVEVRVHAADTSCLMTTYTSSLRPHTLVA